MIASVADTSQVAEARRTATQLAHAMGFNETDTGRIALAATEMATNLLKHAGRGEIVLAPFADGEGAGLELIALDRGPGIGDLERVLQDGFSTAGGAGTGLGAIRRQADHFSLWSWPGCGTAVLARFCRTRAAGGTALGAILAPIGGEHECGDGWAYDEAAAGPTLLMVDGSGHGRHAAAAAATAAAMFRAHAEAGCPELVARLHEALAPTRGAAVAVARIDRRAAIVRFVGVGNIGGAVVGGMGVKRMVSHNGVAGHNAPRMREFTYPWHDGASIVLHSDGISGKWDLARYPGLAASHPSLIAGVLFRDHRRPRDDAGVAVMRAA